MKVFNREVKNCIECKFYDYRQDKCMYLGLRTANRLNEFNFKPFKEIFDECPFNKPLTKEDIESFGFVFATKSIDDWYYKEGEYETEQFNTNRFYKLQLQFSRKDEICKICAIDTDNSEYILFNGKITSKPHLEFILNTLNIIQNDKN